MCSACSLAQCTCSVARVSDQTLRPWVVNAIRQRPEGGVAAVLPQRVGRVPSRPPRRRVGDDDDEIDGGMEVAEVEEEGLFVLLVMQYKLVII